jgi:cytochrome b561
MSQASARSSSLQRQHYHPVAKILHWIIAAMIVLQFVLAKFAEDAATPMQELALLANHKSVGITIFLCACLRLAWRLRQGVPPPLPMPGWQAIASRISHWTLYGLIFLMPITGWLMSSASAYSVSWFNLVPLPDLVSADPDLKETLEAIHKTLAKLMFAIAAVHITAALRHSLKKDGAIARIASTGTTILFTAIIALGVLTLTRVGDGSGNLDISATDATGSMITTGPSDLPAWNIDYESSYIKFVATQAGADINGEWQDWTADIHFDETQLDAGLFDVSVVVAAVETLDVDRDRTLQDLEWFDTDNFPLVRYLASGFKANPNDGFDASGSLTVKDRSTPVTLMFTVSQVDGNYVLDGVAKLDRTALQVGIGEWADTTWVGQFVTVVVHVETFE